MKPDQNSRSKNGRTLAIVLPILVVLILGIAAIIKMQQVTEFSVSLGKNVSIQAKNAYGVTTQTKSIVVIGPIINRLDDMHLRDIRDSVNDCKPRSAQDVASYSAQENQRQGSYSVLILCIPSLSGKDVVSFDAYQLLGANLDRDRWMQKLRTYPEDIVPVLSYWGGQDSVSWLKRKGSKVVIEGEAKL